MTALPTPTPHDHNQDHAARRAADRAFDGLNPDFDIRADSGDAWQRAYEQVNEDLFLRGQRVAVAEFQENDQEPDYRISVVHQRAALARERAAEQAFTTLNPDFGVLVDRDDPDQQSFAHQREAALALGVRAAAALRDEHHPDRQQRQGAIAGRARTAAARDRVDRLRQQPRGDRPQPAAQRRPDRSHHRRSSDRRQLAEREEERSR
jgi:hypothetical protein